MPQHVPVNVTFRELVLQLTDHCVSVGRSEFEEDGVDTSCVVRAEGHPSPFTYIIVDRAGATAHEGCQLSH